MYRYFTNATGIAREIIEKKVKEGNKVIDATIGNGYDTLIIAGLVGTTGKVFGFDIQDLAIKNTQTRLIENKLQERVVLIKDSHDNMDKYITEKVDLIIFNLGYLPGGNHNIVTKFDTTLIALEKSLKLLRENGILLVTTYIGHSEGKVEDEYIQKYISELDQKKFSVLKFEFINQMNNPPILYGVEKISKKSGGNI